MLELAGLFADDDQGLPAVEAVNLKVHAGEIVGIAGVSGNGQSELVEVLSGQREPTDGQLFIHGKPFVPTRDHMDKYKVFGLQEEPLRNAAVPRMTVAENISFRTFDKPPITSLGWWLSPGPMRARARELIAAYRVKTPSTEEPIENLSGGNVQRAVLARELSGDVEVLIVANPCFGLDFASVAEIRSQIMEQRNRGAAVLLVSEDLDEILELADRIAVMSGGSIDYVVAGGGRRPHGHRPRHGGALTCMIAVDAEPFAYTFPPDKVALIVIDMQRDFVEPGGFGETLGNDVTRLQAIVPTVERADRPLPRARLAGDPYARGAQARPLRLPAGQARARQPDA